MWPRISYHGITVHVRIISAAVQYSKIALFTQYFSQLVYGYLGTVLDLALRVLLRHDDTW